MGMVSASFHRPGKCGGPTSFKQKEFGKTIVTRADISVRFANELLDKDRNNEKNGRRCGAGCIHKQVVRGGRRGNID